MRSDRSDRSTTPARRPSAGRAWARALLPHRAARSGARTDRGAERAAPAPPTSGRARPRPSAGDRPAGGRRGSRSRRPGRSRPGRWSRAPSPARPSRPPRSRRPPIPRPSPTPPRGADRRSGLGKARSSPAAARCRRARPRPPARPRSARSGRRGRPGSACCPRGSAGRRRPRGSAPRPRPSPRGGGWSRSVQARRRSSDRSWVRSSAPATPLIPPRQPRGPFEVLDGGCVTGPVSLC